MKAHLYKISGYEEAIMSLRMSQSKFYSWEKAQDVQRLVYVCTDEQGFLSSEDEYELKVQSLRYANKSDNKITGEYQKDTEEFKRLLRLTFNNAMGEFDHHTLMKYIDISFFTEDMHRGAQDDLDAHAQRFNNRITRFSTRLAEINEPNVSEWYKDKVIPIHDALKELQDYEGLPQYIKKDDTVYELTPFGYVSEKYNRISKKNGLYKDVIRGLIPLGQAGSALWKIDLHELRYVYFRRSRMTKANPELKLVMEQLADQIEERLPVFGEYFRKELTDSGRWEHVNKVRTITHEEWEQFNRKGE